MEIITTTGARSLALSGSRVLPGVAMSENGAAARLRVVGTMQRAGFGWPLARRDLVAPHVVQLQNFVASIGTTGVPVAGRMRVSAPEP